MLEKRSTGRFLTLPYILLQICLLFLRQWYYWYLTDEGIDYLREYLHLPGDIVPNTHKKANINRARPFRGGDDRYDGRKEGGPGHDFRPNFGGEGGQRGFGRGGGGF